MTVHSGFQELSEDMVFLGYVRLDGVMTAQFEILGPQGGIIAFTKEALAEHAGNITLDGAAHEQAEEVLRQWPSDAPPSIEEYLDGDR